jgi:enterochelin esterase-like enzyme
MRANCSRLLVVAILPLFLLSSAGFGADEKPRPVKPPPIVSGEVHSDRTVTFRLLAPNAKEVKVSGLPVDPVVMTKDENGLWSGTVGPLPPEIYIYSLVVDGLRMIDRGNPVVKAGRSPKESLVQVPGDPPLMHEFQSVPHGTEHLHDYFSKSLNVVRSVRVYTPPGYEHDSQTQYPVLYLFHGSGDDESGWTVIGHANWIMDNLLAQGKARPMLIVMPNGHTPTTAGANNTANFERDLLEEVIPLVEKTYHVKADRLHRAIAGLSMGAGQSMTIGLNHLDEFAWVGAMSGYPFAGVDSVSKGLNDPQANEKLKLLWSAIGKDDFLLKGTTEFDHVLTERHVNHQFTITEGTHGWPVFRKYLVQFAPLLFTE